VGDLVSLLNPFYDAIAWLIVHIHAGLSPIFGASSGAAWALSIVLLTMAMRLLLFPLFVKQIKSQRAMSALQPQMKELQAKYKNDKERLNTEMMALWKEAGTNPFAGCLPIIVQIPVFFALFKVLNSLHPNKAGQYTSHFHGILTANLTAQAAHAKVFGVPIGASFSSSKHALDQLSASATSTKALAAILIVIMGATTFITQRQLMARNKASGGPSMPGNQQTLLYILPLVFAVFGLKFPIGVLLYWLTTNLWSMGQQAIVIRRMDNRAAPAAATGSAASGAAVMPSGPAPGAKPIRPATSPPSPSGSGNPTNGSKPGSGGSAARRPPGRNQKKKRGRR
jgi:YidC/Oxa1 family membrane protein insertase